MMLPNGQYAEDIQCVLPPLKPHFAIYISNIEAASNPMTLKKYQIGAVITAVKDKDISKLLPKQMEYLYVPVIDHVSCDLSVHFATTNQFLSDQLIKNNVLVHCIAGVSRSVTLVIAYLMQAKQISFKLAYEMIKNKRPIIHPNQAFIHQLKNYQLVLKANRKENKSNKYKKNQGFILTVKNNNIEQSNQKQNSTYKRTNNIIHSTHPTKERIIHHNHQYDENLKDNIRILFKSKLSSSHIYDGKLFRY